MSTTLVIDDSVLEEVKKLRGATGGGVGWAVFGFAGNTNAPGVRSRGGLTVKALSSQVERGSWADFVAALRTPEENEVRFGFTRLEVTVDRDGSGGCTVKFVFVTFVGANVGGLQRGRVYIQKNFVKEAILAIQPPTLDIHAEEVEDLQPPQLTKFIGGEIRSANSTSPASSATSSQSTISKGPAAVIAPAAAPAEEYEYHQPQEEQRQEGEEQINQPEQESALEQPKSEPETSQEVHEQEEHHNDEVEDSEEDQERRALFNQLASASAEDAVPFIDIFELSQLLTQRFHDLEGWVVLNEDKGLVGLLEAHYRETGGRIHFSQFRELLDFLEQTLTDYSYHPSASDSSRFPLEDAPDLLRQALGDRVLSFDIRLETLKELIHYYHPAEGGHKDEQVSKGSLLGVALYLQELHSFHELSQQSDSAGSLNISPQDAAMLTLSVPNSVKATQFANVVRSIDPTNFSEFLTTVLHIRFDSQFDDGFKVTFNRRPAAAAPAGARTNIAGAAPRPSLAVPSAKASSTPVTAPSKSAPSELAKAPSSHKMRAPLIPISENRRQSMLQVKEQSMKNMPEVASLQKLMEECRSKGKKYEDPQFPAAPSSLFPSNPNLSKSVTRWRRPEEISPNPQLFVDGVEEGDVQQGSLGDCWFISALSVLAAAEGNLVSNVITAAYPKEGVYQCRFYKNGEWKFVTIDDRIPCGSSGKPFFASCRDPNEMWVPIVEKAYAKLHGNYGAIEAGDVNEGLVDLTGEVSEHIILGNDKSSTPKDAALFKRLAENIKESYLMGCSIVSKESAMEEKTSQGLLKNHAYAIIDCQEVQGVKLLRLRNPWGQFEWKGRWSDGSKEWTPQLKKHFNFEFGDDGTFFMCFEDFVANFNRIYVSRLMTDDIGVVWDRFNFKSEWKGPTAGGCSNYSTWVNNPQFGLSVKERDTRVFFSLMQPDQRLASKSSEGIYSVAIGAYVLTAGDIQFRKTSISNRDIHADAVFLRGREFSMEFVAQPGQCYIIMPAQFVPSTESPFFLSVFTSKRGAEVKPIAEALQATTTAGAWIKGRTAGGCTNHSSWTTNPQFAFTFSDSGEAEFFLEQNNGKNPAIPIGLYVFKPLPAGSPVKKQQKVADILGNSEFINLPSVSYTTRVEKNVTYAVMPTTFEPNKDLTFKVGARPKNPALKVTIKPISS